MPGFANLTALDLDLELQPGSIEGSGETTARFIYRNGKIYVSRSGGVFLPLAFEGQAGGGSILLGVPLLGAVNGANKTFSTPVPFAQISVYLNGVKQTESDFVITGPQSIEMSAAPTGGAEPDILTCDFTPS